MSLSKPRERGEGFSRLVPSRVVEEPGVPPEDREAPKELNIRGTGSDIRNIVSKAGRIAICKADSFLTSRHQIILCLDA